MDLAWQASFFYRLIAVYGQSSSQMSATRVVGGQKNDFSRFGGEKSIDHYFPPPGGLELGGLKYALVSGFPDTNF